MKEGDIERLAEFIRNSKYTVVLTGAGISTSAGIPDFRGSKGIYTLKLYDPYKTFSYDYFIKDPSYFFKFAREFASLYKKIKPTRMHNLLAKLESLGYVKVVITQNIDGLHQRAGSRNVIEIHGGFDKGYCLSCGKRYVFDEMMDMVLKEGEMRCRECGGIVKPDIVFFGEPVKHIFEAEEHALNSDLFIVIGSSLAVQPAASLPLMSRGKKVIINKGTVEIPYIGFDIFINEDIEYVAERLSSYF